MAATSQSPAEDSAEQAAEPSVAESLEGQTLPGGWRVLRRRVAEALDTTGGFFSVAYDVESENGAPAFLKVLDYERMMAFAQDPAEALNLMTTAYLHEKDVLAIAGEKRMSHVVRALDTGVAAISLPDGRAERVNFLVFELAEGDARQVIDGGGAHDAVWRLRLLHQATVGMRQLHSANVAHQDLKPSNVLVYQLDPSKVADLGTSSIKGKQGWRDNAPIAGDRTYAPPELLYGQLAPEWNQRRMACDLFHVGSLAVYLFTGQAMTSQLIEELAPQHRPGAWGDSYAEALVHVRSAFDRVMQFVESQCPECVRADLNARIRELCDPDPNLRGHPTDRTGHRNPYSLERYVADFDKLARKAEINRRHQAGP